MTPEHRGLLDVLVGYLVCRIAFRQHILHYLFFLDARNHSDKVGL